MDDCISFEGGGIAGGDPEVTCSSHDASDSGEPHSALGIEGSTLSCSAAIGDPTLCLALLAAWVLRWT